ncbi:MAG TPA: ABC transporter substrate-binding protein [Dehalococcoidia bacterium]|nr:ABC transporter substrate-binding protein [Dehalococcoidia bacterium]
MSNYWDRVMNRRVGRRRAIAVTGATGAAAAFLAACGGSSNNSGSTSGSSASGSTAASGGSGASGATGPVDKSGLLTPLTDQTKNAIKGGTYIDSHPGVILTHDPMKTGINIRGARRGFSQLLRVADGFMAPPDGTIEGDLAQSYELSPDKMTLTLKLDPSAAFAPVDPVNGRVADTQDVLFSWNRLQTEGIGASELSNAKNPGAPITSVTAPDKSTVVIKLNSPNSTILGLIGSQVLGSWYILAQEAADPSKIDIARKPIGTGPYYLTEDSEIKYTWKKNPNFKRAKLTNGEPFIDEIQEPVVPEQATGVAQFRAGALYEYGVPSNDLLGTKKDIPALTMRATDVGITGTERIFFGTAEGSPFKDARVRIAYMKAIDRDSFIIAAHNTDNYAKAGLPVSAYWETSIPRGVYEGWWLDPSDAKTWGANQANNVYDLAEAKKLIEAAGLKTPLEFDEVYAQPGPSSFPQSFYNRADIFLGMLENSEGVFKMNRKLINYQTEWNNDSYRFSKGNFVGASWGPDTSTQDPASAAFFTFNSAGGYYQGGDQKMDDLTNQARAEFDDDKRKQIVYDIQRHNSDILFNTKIGVAGGFALNWPVIQNIAIYRGGTNWLCVTTPSGLRAWLDPSQPPLKK